MESKARQNVSQQIRIRIRVEVNRLGTYVLFRAYLRFAMQERTIGTSYYASSLNYLGYRPFADPEFTAGATSYDDVHTRMVRSFDFPWLSVWVNWLVLILYYPYLLLILSEFFNI